MIFNVVSSNKVFHNFIKEQVNLILGVFTAIIAIICVTLLIYFISVTEINEFDYNQVFQAAKTNPRIKEQVKILMEDGYISNNEFSSLHNLFPVKNDLEQFLRQSD